MADIKKDNQQKTEAKAMRRKLSGVVMSDKMTSTIVVRVDNVVVHPKYKKRYTVSKKYKVHDAKNQYKVGDKVSFLECRPLSAEKRWRVIYSNK
jgi:small subunit ribosomal protein S17